MIWLSYRQARLQLTIGLAVLAATALALGLTGPHLADLAKTENFLEQASRSTLSGFLYVTSILLTYAVPALIGAFWGAPLIAREVESGTHRLIWTQGVSRTRWLAYRLGLGAAAVLVVSGLLTLAFSWWSAPIDRAVPDEGPTGVFSFYRMSPFLFGVRDVVPIGYALFGFVLGVVVGLLVRRTLVAFGLTMALLLVVQVGMPMLVRAHLATPVDTTVAITLDNLRGLEGTGAPRDFRFKTFHISGAGSADWTLEEQTVDRNGTAPGSLPMWIEACMPNPTQPESSDAVRTACIDRLADEGLRQHIVYHPDSAYWTLQWRETGLLVAGAMLLSGFAFWRIRRDL
jgi:hypothetical protein